MQRVLVLDKQKQPLMPCHPARARQLLREGKAAVFRRVPFTIILREREGGETQPVELKIDPGSKTTGIALVTNGRVVWAAELHHRGEWSAHATALDGSTVPSCIGRMATIIAAERRSVVSSTAVETAWFPPREFL